MTKNLAIVVSGGPAPGINCLISSIAIEAINSGWNVLGCQGGFLELCTNEEPPVEKLSIERVAHIIDRGGSILGTSRFNPLRTDESSARFEKVIQKYNINMLAVVGGEGSAYLSYLITNKYPKLQVVHLPKTIDNDLPLPNNYPSFGYSTARFAGTNLISSLTRDAKTVGKRWFLVTCMGRKAGFLTLGVGLSAGTTLSVIPEEISENAPAQDVADIVFNSIKKRYRSGKGYGVALLAEGIVDKLSPDSCDALRKCPRDDLGRVQFHFVQIAEVIAPMLRKMCEDENIDVRLTPYNIGYELRCHSPVASDIEYTKYLGVGAVRYLKQGKSCVMIVRDDDDISCIELKTLLEKDGKRIMSRTVNLDSDLYKVARSFMIT